MLQLFLVVTLAIVVSALTNIIEVVLYSVPASHVEVLARAGTRSGRLLKRFKADVQKPITAVLILNNIANIMGAAVAGAVAASVLGEQLLAPFSAAFTLVVMLFAEIIPKTLGVTHARALAPWIALPLNWLVTILTPIIWLVRFTTRMVSAGSGEVLVSAEEVQMIATLGLKSGAIDPDQERVIKNILQLKHRNVRKVMTPRTVTFSLTEHLTVAEAKERVAEWSRHSRVPVYDMDPDDVVGIVLRKDVFNAIAQGQDHLRLTDLMHPVHFVPESAPLHRVLIEFLERHQHLFVVVDEYGSVTGVVSLEDVLEEIVGQEIIDESDQAKDMRELARLKRRAIQNEDTRI